MYEYIRKEIPWSYTILETKLNCNQHINNIPSPMHPTPSLSNPPFFSYSSFYPTDHRLFDLLSNQTSSPSMHPTVNSTPPLIPHFFFPSMRSLFSILSYSISTTPYRLESGNIHTVHPIVRDNPPRFLLIPSPFSLPPLSASAPL